ncbi:hypothetical protein GBF38_018438, partial [Nibea albiflora]
MMRLPVLLSLLLCLAAAPGPVAGADRSCTDLRQFYTGKGFILTGVPLTEISGQLCSDQPQLSKPSVSRSVDPLHISIIALFWGIVIVRCRAGVCVCVCVSRASLCT